MPEIRVGPGPPGGPPARRGSLGVGSGCHGGGLGSTVTWTLPVPLAVAGRRSPLARALSVLAHAFRTSLAVASTRSRCKLTRDL